MVVDCVKPESDGFVLDQDSIQLPRGAWAKTHRQVLRYNGREIFALNQGQFRPYLYPVYSPKGFAVTSESPADHPHHNSVWIGSDHVTCRVPGAYGRFEDYTYNFYVNETFQGRAAGKIVAISTIGETTASNHYIITQMLEWYGPPEWGAAQGRLIALEERTYDVMPGEAHHIIDVRSEMRATEWELALGPTRHAFFNVRIAPSMQVTSNGNIHDAEGRVDAQSISESNTDWVDLNGPVGGGYEAGITLMPHPDCGPPSWFVSDWGVMSVGHIRDEKKRIAIGESSIFNFRMVIRDVDDGATDIAAIYREYVKRARK